MGKRRGTISRTGFTLIELLVVIGIVVVLLAILMPALTAARAQSRAIVCASNLRQIHLTCVQIATEGRGKIPNNSYTLGDNPATINPPPPPGTPGAAAAASRDLFSTSNLQWFDAVALRHGWQGKASVAARFGAGEHHSFRLATQYLWCPDVDQEPRDPSVFSTSYGISLTISKAYARKGPNPPVGAGAYAFDFLFYTKVPRHAEVVFLSECSFRNYNSEPYNFTNGSMGNLSRFNAVKCRPKIRHRGLNYLFFDGHVTRLRKPPHSLGIEVGTFVTIENDTFSITTGEDSAFRQVLGSL